MKINEINSGLTMAVLVPTYKRPKDLERCLIALTKQTLQPRQVIVVKRIDDYETGEVLRMFAGKILPLEVCNVDKPGVVYAMNCGIQKVTSDITVITDDDSEAPADWIKKIQEAFNDNPFASGIGGRDQVTFPDGAAMHGKADQVGRITAYGKIIGNHHIGTGGIRCVEIIKGVNSAYRTEALKSCGFDENLKGVGAQTHWEVVLGRLVSSKHGKLLYDPNILLTHYVSQRHDEDQRLEFNKQAFFNSVHNEFYSISIGAKIWKIFIYLMWHTLIGHKSSPGIAYTLAKFTTSLEGNVIYFFWIAILARIEVFFTIKKAKRTRLCFLQR